MRQMLVLLFLSFIVYVAYYDLSKGTLPLSTETRTNVHETGKSRSKTAAYNLDYFEKEVKNGETVLSIVEGNIESSLPVSMERLISDFKMLNNGLEPEKIRPGEKYKFPVYPE